MIESPANELRTIVSRRDIRGVTIVIFDTVLSRLGGDIMSVYRRTADLLARRHGLVVSRDAFALERAEAARRAAYNRQGRAANLWEIHMELGFVLGMPHLAEDMATAELEAEYDLIVPTPGAKDIVAAARTALGSVTFLSHSPLPVEFLRDTLGRFDLLHEDDSIITANDQGVHDDGGDLLAAASTRRGVEPRYWLHVGDSLQRDIAPAQKLGMNILHCAAVHPLPAEQALLDLSDELVDTASFLAGAAQATRLRAPGTLTTEQMAAWDTGATVTGPLVYAMARRLLDRARARGIKRLLFLARDGLLPFLAVQHMLQTDGPDDLTATYVYGSRATYYPLICRQLGPDEWDDLTSFFGKSYQTLGELCDALGTETATMQTHLRRLTGKDISADAPLAAELLALVKRHVIEDPELHAAVSAGITHLQDMMLQHLRDLGLRHGEPVGLIDAGWSGRSHGPLYLFLQSRNASSVTMFYAGHPVVGTFQPLFDPGDVETLLFNEHSRLGYCNFYFTPSLNIAPMLDISYPQTVEMLCHADHGRTVSFRSDDGKVAPTLRPHENQEFVAAVFPTYRSAVLACVEAIHARRSLLPPYDNFSHIAQRICERFWLRPTRTEAALWQRWMWANDPHDRELFSITRPYRVRDAVAVLWSGRLPHLQPQFWTSAALILSPRPTQLILKAALTIRAFIVWALPPQLARRLFSIKQRLEKQWQRIKTAR
jgi:FMN phosphatase YigB (HAD superfamily)